MLVELWLATTWFLYSYNPVQNQPTVSNSQCLPSCLVADSLLGNIMAESDVGLDGIKCSFLSFLTEICWSHPAQTHCAASSDGSSRDGASNTLNLGRTDDGSSRDGASNTLNLGRTDDGSSRDGASDGASNTLNLGRTESGSRETLTKWYNDHCTKNQTGSCFAIFSKKASVLNGHKIRSKCAGEYESLLRELLTSEDPCTLSSKSAYDRERKILRFKDCARRQADPTCRIQVINFIDTFTDHIKQSNATCSSVD